MVVPCTWNTFPAFLVCKPQVNIKLPFSSSLLKVYNFPTSQVEVICLALKAPGHCIISVAHICPCGLLNCRSPRAGIAVNLHVVCTPAFHMPMLTKLEIPLYRKPIFCDIFPHYSFCAMEKIIHLTHCRPSLFKLNS